MSTWIEAIWYEKHPLRKVLQPFSWLFAGVALVRRKILERFFQEDCPVPLIVVGNITVGGVGKTPLVIALAQEFQKKGLKVGIVSRGYGAKSQVFPREVLPQDSAMDVGDEPLLLAKKANCPVVIAPKRMTAVRYLLSTYACQIIISDDGLQHYRMGRSIEIAVLDGTRGVGNGLCLPAGPLREPVSRLKNVDLLVVNEGHWDKAYSMKLEPLPIRALSTGAEIDPSLLSQPWEAVAAIGNPQRFYSTLSQLGIEFSSCSYPDHYQFRAQDFDYLESLVIMTEKDAVKCNAFSTKNMYYLPVHAKLDNAFWHALWSNQHLKGYC